MSFDKHRLNSVGLNLHLRNCIRAALEAQGVPVPCEINVLVTDDEGIRAINRAYRQVDAATDVLSFPMFRFIPGELPSDLTPYLDAQTGLLPLGDMAISLPRAKAQAKEYGHSLKREIGYLTVHSVLHLLGYDHMDEGPMKAQMRAKEEEIMQKMDLSR
ncbi:MAG: rRNA maturation RNase YbeY [Oscillospiraceae bacterium]|nr:rRNA maturation RNase YbeY [Oscillospiraceae bacterium]